MGCGKSRLDHDVDSCKNAIVTEEDNVIENETESAKIEAVEATDMQGSKISEMSVPRFKHITTSKPAVTSRKLSLARKSENGREIDLNAWGEKRTKKNAQNTALTQQGKIGDDSDFESEYGRDGVDLASTHMNKALGPRLSPDGTNFTSYSEGQNKISALQKVESDETCDPSTLIDNETFKAANAPTKPAITSTHVSENAIENDVSLMDNNVKEAKNATTPSNYNEFYGDDEKELIESIEKNFVAMSPPVLPGSVM